MTKLPKEVFIQTVVEVLREKGFDIEEIKHSKTNYPYNGITLRCDKNGCARPVINADSIYDDYMNNNILLTEAIDKIEKIFKENPISKSDDYMRRVNDFEYVKDNLIIEVYGVNKNTEVLISCVHKKHEDLAIVPKIHLGSYNGGQIVCAIPNRMLDEYGISNDELVSIAVENSQKIRPAKIESFKDIILSQYANHLIMFGQADEYADKEQLIQELRNDKDLLEQLFPLKSFEYVITNEQVSHGAAAAFYPGVLEKLYRDIGESFYLIPSSVHEMLVIPCSYIMASSTTLQELVHTVNRDKNVMRDEDILTDSVYIYDGSFHKV